MKKLKIPFLILIALTAISCQKEITVDLRDTDPRIVIEGNITSEGGPHEFFISRSGSYFDNSTIEMVSGAAVTLSDELGNEEVLDEISTGVFRSEEIEGIPGTTYHIRVEADGLVYEASEYLPYKIEIEDIGSEVEELSDLSPDGEQYYNILCTFTDPAETDNFYRFVIFINGELYERDFNRYTVFDDELIDGRTFTITLRGTEALLGDTVMLELQSIGPATYDYYRTLNDALNGGVGSTPYNPITNLNNEALGYFGAYNVSRETIIIE